MKCFAVGLLVAACGGGGDDGPAPDPDGPACTPAATKTVYLNRTGGAYTKGATDDSTTNTSSIINATITLPAPNVVESDWSTVLACVKSKFTPFAVEITETDPGTAPHIEMVVIDMATQIGLGQGTGSVSPFSCGVLPNALQFISWTENPDNATRCWTMAQTVANAFGLDHVLECTDLMTFMSSCGAVDAKTFTDTATQCGEFTARKCCSGAQIQNSTEKLLAGAGPSCN